MEKGNIYIKKVKKWLEESISKNCGMKPIFLNKAIYNVPCWGKDLLLSPIEIPLFPPTFDKCVGSVIPFLCKQTMYDNP